MNVNRDVADSKEYLSKLNSGLKDRITLKEKEIEAVNKIYDQKIESTKQEGEDRYLNAIDQNQQKLGTVVRDYEEKLSEYRTNLEKTKLKLDEEQKLLKDNSELTLHNLKIKGEENHNDLFKTIVDNQEQLHFDSNNKMKNLILDSKSEISKLKSEADYDLSKLEHQKNLEFNKKTSDFQNQLDGLTKSQTNAMRTQEDEFKEQFKQTMNDQKRLVDEKTRINTDRLNYLDSFHQSLVQQKEQDFKIKYQNIVNQHEEMLNDIQKKFDSEVRNLQESTSKQKSMISEKASDPFYRIQTIEPTITDLGKEVLFELPVANHEWENVHLSVQGRNVKMTLGRKFSDEYTSDLGQRNKSSRSELFSKELQVADLLNAKTITQKYENGKVQFKVAKL